MFLTSTRKTDLPKCHQFSQRLLPPSAQALTPRAVMAPFSNLPTNPTDLSTLPPPLSADAHDDASRPLNGYLLPVPLHALLDNTRQRVSSHHGLLRMLRQLRLGDWDYPHLVALCILTRHVCVGVHTVTAAAHRVIATLLHAAHILALCFCAATRPPIDATTVSGELTPRNTVDRPAAGRESSRHQTRWAALAWYSAHRSSTIQTDARWRLQVPACSPSLVFINATVRLRVCTVLWSSTRFGVYCHCNPCPCMQSVRHSPPPFSAGFFFALFLAFLWSSGLFLFLCSACAVLCWCACVALCAVLSCPCFAAWCFVLLPVAFACLLLGLVVLCCLPVGPGGSWCRVSVVCCVVSLGAVLRSVAARCAALRCVVVLCVVSFCSVWCCRALCRVLGLFPSPWGPMPSSAIFCLVSPRCVCSAVTCCRVVLFFLVLCAVGILGCPAVCSLSSPPCVVLLCGPAPPWCPAPLCCAPW